MKIIATYCSAKKQKKQILVPAIQLYDSERIRRSEKKAIEKGLQLFIFSGKYGLISSDQRIRNYDHLLQKEEIEKHSKLVNEQLTSNDIKEIIFYVGNFKSDLNILSYIECLKKACADRVVLHITEIE